MWYAVPGMWYQDVVLTFTRIIKSGVTGQAPVTLKWKNTPGKDTSNPKVVHAYIIAEAIHESAKKYKQMNSEVSLRARQAHTGTYVSILALEKPTTPHTTQGTQPKYKPDERIKWNKQ